MSERLEEVKNSYFEWLHRLFGTPWVSMPKENFGFLIKQAERVEELEEENKRYREVLEYVSNELDHAYTTGIYEQKDELIIESINVIDKALEGRT